MKVNFYHGFKLINLRKRQNMYIIVISWNMKRSWSFFLEISKIFLLSCLVKSGRSPPITGSRQTTNQPSLPADTSSQLSVLSARNSVENLSIQLDVHFQQAGNLIMFSDWYFRYLAFYCYDTMNIDPEARPGIFLSLKYYNMTFSWISWSGNIYIYIYVHVNLGAVLSAVLDVRVIIRYTPDTPSFSLEFEPSDEVRPWYTTRAVSEWERERDSTVTER